MTNNILMRLKAGRQYLKTDFKIHTASECPCADHCRVFALSKTETEYKGQCQHQHTITCDRCKDLKNAVSDLQLAVDSSEVHHRKEHTFDRKAEFSIYSPLTTSFPELFFTLPGALVGLNLMKISF